MATAADRPSGVARVRRTVGVVIAVVLVAAPILAGLVLAWQVHPLLVLPAYLLGIPVWLTLLSGVWAVVRRVRPAGETQDVAPSAAVVPTVTTELRLPHPRSEGTAPRELRTPIP